MTQVSPVSRASPNHINNLFKPVFHFNRTVPKRGVFLCLVSFEAELMTLGQTKTLRFGTVRLEWKTGFRTKENATFRYGTVAVENGLKAGFHLGKLP